MKILIFIIIINIYIYIYILALRYINSLKTHQKIPYCDIVLSTVIPRIIELRYI